MHSIFKVVRKDDNIKNSNEIENDGFATDISKSDLWVEQQKEIVLFLKMFKKQIKIFHKKDCCVFIELGIDPADMSKTENELLLHKNIELLKLLESLDVKYEVSTEEEKRGEPAYGSFCVHSKIS